MLRLRECVCKINERLDTSHHYLIGFCYLSPEFGTLGLWNEMLSHNYVGR
jgi:hypothetical protein